jgi:hypothetical protein
VVGSAATTDVLNEAPVWNGLDGHRWLRETEKEFPSVTGVATIEPKGELVQVVIQVRLGHGTLVGPEEPAREQGDHAVDPWESFGGELMVAPQIGDAMAIAVRLHAVVPMPPVGVNLRPGLRSPPA